MSATRPLWDFIVVGVALRDDDQPALDLARELARTTGAQLALVHASPEAEGLEELETIAMGLCDVTEVAVYLRASGSPVRALHELAEELGASAIVVGASHRGSVGRVAPGGIGERLLHAAPCAVAVAPRGYAVRAPDLRRIGVAYGEGPESAEALAIAAAIAHRSGGRVDLVTVLDPSGSGDPERARARLDAARRAVAPEAAGSLQVLEGRAAERLAATSSHFDLLVCGSRGYGPVHSLVVGGVSSALAHAAACPLLVVPRPADGHVSPAPASADLLRARPASPA